MSSQKKTVVLLISLATILIVGLGFIKYVLPSILTNLYKHQLSNQFNEEFPPLDKYFNEMGISFTKSYPAQCDNGPYSPSSPCSIGRSTIQGAQPYLTFDQPAKTKWLARAPELDDYLASHGWKFKKDERTTTFADIFNIQTPGIYQYYASYSKGDCLLTFDYLLDTPYGHGNVNEDCSKYSRSPSEWFRSK